MASCLCSKSSTPYQCHPRFVGDIAQPSEIDPDAVIKVTDLQIGDPVWVKRSNNSWTLAVVQEREGSGRHASAVIVVSSHGATKKLSSNQCRKLLKKVIADNRCANNNNDTHKPDPIVSPSMDSYTIDDNRGVTPEKTTPKHMRTFLDSVESYLLLHHDAITIGNNIDHHAESIHSMVDHYFFKHNENNSGSTNIDQSSQTPTTESVATVDSIPKNSKHANYDEDASPLLSEQPMRRVTFKLQDQLLGSFRLRKGQGAGGRDERTRPSQRTMTMTSSLTLKTDTDQSLTTREIHRDSWSVKVKKMARNSFSLTSSKQTSATSDVEEGTQHQQTNANRKQNKGRPTSPDHHRHPHEAHRVYLSGNDQSLTPRENCRESWSMKVKKIARNSISLRPNKQTTTDNKEETQHQRLKKGESTPIQYHHHEAHRESLSAQVRKSAIRLLKTPKKNNILLNSDRQSSDQLSHADIVVHSSQHPSSTKSSEILLHPPIFGYHETKIDNVIHVDVNALVSKKKLNNINQGERISLKSKMAGFESFQHALQSIHKRSSLFLPPASGCGVTLH